MLVDATLPVPASLMTLLAGLAPLFTAPSFRTFCGLACGFLAQTGKRTVCGTLAGAGLARCWSHDRAHRFFSCARWSPDELGLAVARLVVALLVPTGEPVVVAIDDTLFRRRGKKYLLPASLNRVSSTATSTGAPAGTSSDTTSTAAARPRSSAFHRAREKNQCARSCGHTRDSLAPVSIPQTVRFPGWARKPQARAVKVRNDGAVNSGANAWSSVISDAGTMSGSISGRPFP